MSRAEAWIDGHERLCAERFQALRADMRWALTGVMAVFVALIGWMAVQLYNDIKPASVPQAIVAQK